jgi:hypothetical protein
MIHPTAFAAWVGFLVTALNLLPVGQLDGGHVARALLGSNAKYLSWATIAVLVGLGLSGLYLGWLLFAVIILFLGVRHPPPLNDMTKLDLKRKAVGVATFVVLIIAFVPIPLVSLNPTYSFEMTNIGSTNATMAPGESHTFSVLVNNTGNAFNDIEFTVDSPPVGWSAEFKEHHLNESAFAPKYLVSLNSSQNVTIDVNVKSSSASSFGTNSTIAIRGTSQNSTSTVHIVTYNLTIVSPAFTFWIVNDGLTIAPGTWGNVTVQVNNTGPVASNVTLNATGRQPLFVDALLVIDGQNSTGPLNVTVPGQGNATFYVEIYVSPMAAAGMKTVFVDSLYHGVELQTLGIRINVS